MGIDGGENNGIKMSAEQTGILVEGKCVDYERYALNRLFHDFVQKYGITDVCEVPAKGEKAMPSLYSIAFGEAGCRVTLVNAEEKSKKAWRELGFKIAYIDCDDLNHTGMDSGQYDLVWNFQHLSQHGEKEALLAEMTRLSRRYIMSVAVNRFNPGFFSHRCTHRLFRIPWNHGDIPYMNLFHVRRQFEESGLKIVKAGFVDMPPFPDSMGIRDLKLHRKEMDLNKADWDSRTLTWMKRGAYPVRIKLLYLFERLRLPFPLKLMASHLFYILAEKQSEHQIV